MNNYIDFINFSNYSLGRGMQKIDDIIKSAKDNGRNYASLTDHNTLSGVPEFVEACEAENIKPIIGSTISIKKEDNYIGDLTFLAKNKKGFDDLKAMITELGTFKVYDERCLDIEIVKKYISKGNLLVVEGAKNSIIFNIEEQNHYQEIFNELKAVAKQNLVATIQPMIDQNKLTNTAKRMFTTIKSNMNISKQKTRMFFSNNNRFAQKSDYIFQINKMHENSHHQPILKKSGDILENSGIDRTDTHLSSEYLNETLSKFYTKNTSSLFLSDSITKEFESPDIFKDFSFPKLSEDENLKEIMNKTWNEFKNTIPEEDKPKYLKRLKEEVDLFEKMNFSDYFVVVNEIAKNAKQQGQTLAIRGSGSASLVVFMLGLSQVDPVRHNLIFSRFMNEGRNEAPDLDVETSHNDEMLNLLKQNYGSKKSVNLMAFDSMKNANVTTDFVLNAFRRYGKKDIEFRKSINKVENKIKKSLGFYKKSPPTVSSLIENNYYWKKDYNEDPAFKMVIDQCIKMEGQITNKKLSPGTVILGNESLENVLSLVKTNKELGSDYYIEVTKDYIQKMGHLKMDVLSSTILNKLNTSAKMASVNLTDILSDIDNPEIYQAISDGNILNINQISSKMKLESEVTEKNRQGIGYSMCKSIQPRNFSELCAVMALIRMGEETKDGEKPEQYQKYIDGRSNPDAIVYKHENLRDVLSRTYGAIVFEEQIMQMSQVIAGFNDTEADFLRGVIKKEKREAIPEIKKRFMEGAINNNIDSKVASDIFADIEAKMGQYQFNEAHAVSYSAIAVQQMYLKLNHPAEFYAVHFSNDKRELYENEMTNLNIFVQRPDINNSSNIDQTIEVITQGSKRKTVDFSLGKIIKDPEILNDILLERDAEGYFEDLFDYVDRILPIYTDCNLMSPNINQEKAKIDSFKRDLRNLITVGAFDKINFLEVKNDNLEQTRSFLIENIDKVVESCLNQFVDVEVELNENISEDKILKKEDIVKIEKDFLNVSPIVMYEKAVEKRNLSKKKSRGRQP